MTGITKPEQCIQEIKGLSDQGLEEIIVLKAAECISAAVYQAEAQYGKSDPILSTYLQTIKTVSTQQIQTVLKQKQGVYLGWPINLTVNKKLPAIVDYLSGEFYKSRRKTEYTKGFYRPVTYLCIEYGDDICKIIDEIGNRNQESQTWIHPDIIDGAKEIVNNISEKKSNENDDLMIGNLLAGMLNDLQGLDGVKIIVCIQR